ncbi:radical SAM/SPASM domain-containing protein [Geomonas azotofigens]|uniref:radical SAM/SPASM domain-containing protein n=1 Tax=Geomonas azotofigens TaxID=2843196 RepID=UPI001C11C47B|nr:radical SAM protein [Geomonas azotofigens]MBU5612545.1 radical SAM protein [Geomonas azotofigens]
MTRHQKYFNQRRCDIGELPDTILVESYMGCNLRCEMCPVPDSRNNMNGRSYSCMSLETYKIIIDQVSERPRSIRLNQLGEPLLNPEIVNFVAYAASRGHDVGLTTNATKLDADLAERLIVAGLGEIIFSFDGCTKETYEKIRVGADYDQVLANILEFSRLNKVHNGRCSVRVDCIVSDLTFGDLEQIRKFWSQRKIPVSFIPIDDWAGKLRLPARFGVRRSLTGSTSKRYPCHFLWTALVISAEGNVVFCCHDYQLLSNLPSVHEKPLREIWNTQVRHMREQHVLGTVTEKPCRSCDAWMSMPEFYRSRLAYLDRLKAKMRSLTGRK